MRLIQKEKQIEKCFRDVDIKGKIDVIADDMGACIELETAYLYINDLEIVNILLRTVGFKMLSISQSHTSGYTYHIDCETIP